MDERPRIFKSGEEARGVIRSAVNKIADVVKMTLGPSGRNALVDRGYRTPRITNDGVFIAQSLDLEDPLEQVCARQLVEAADNTNREAGDGTTTSIVIAQKIINKGLDILDGAGAYVSAQINVMELKKAIDKSLETVIAKLDEQKKEAKDKKVLIDVARTSLEDEEMAEAVADMVMEIGDNGYISVQEGFHGKIETEVIQGMHFDGKYAHEFMITNNQRRAEYLDVPVFITNHHLEEPGDISRLTKRFFSSGRREMVIMSPKFSYETIADMAKLQNAIHPETKQLMGFRILGIKIPALTDEQIEDVCAYTGAKFINKEKGMGLKEWAVEDMGNADKIIVDDDKVQLVNSKNKKTIEERITKLQEEKEVEKDEMFRKKLDVRIASLSSGMGIIKVGSSTEAEKGYKKLKLEDAVFSTKAAYKEGIVKGGGVALEKAAKSLDNDDILYEALLAPGKQIQDNAGGDLKIEKHVLDPVRVTKAALSNGCNVAKMMLTTDTVVAIDRLPEQGDALREIAKALCESEKTQ